MTGDVQPDNDETCTRPTVDPALPTKTSQTVTEYKVNICDPLFADAPIGIRADLVLVKNEIFAPNGKYYHKKHLQPAPTGSSHTHTITIPVVRKAGTNFKQPDCDRTGAFSKRLKKLLIKRMDYAKFMEGEAPLPDQGKSLNTQYRSYKQWCVTSTHTISM